MRGIVGVETGVLGILLRWLRLGCIVSWNQASAFSFGGRAQGSGARMGRALVKAFPKSAP